MAKSCRTPTSTNPTKGTALMIIDPAKKRRPNNNACFLLQFIHLRDLLTDFLPPVPYSLLYAYVRKNKG